MRSYLFVALLATTLCFADARQLAQEAWSNSNGCLPTIPMCQEGACVNTMLPGGTAGWKCLRCRGNYEPVTDSADNIIQCVCARGFFENTTIATNPTCQRCTKNNVCPGGDRTGNPNSARGPLTSCGTTLVTRNDGARTQADCVAPAGYARASPGTAQACDVSEYAPPLNRLTKCLKCQSGLQENPADALAGPPGEGYQGDRISKRKVCKLPPGKYMSQGLVRVCPQGFFRENFVEFDNANGTVCISCNPGITTAGANSMYRTDCNIVEPGYGLRLGNDSATPPTLPTASGAGSTPAGLPEAVQCELGFYSRGGYCWRCPKGTVTLVKGAKAIEECMIPPGYYLPGNGDMTTCANGTFRSDWIMASDPRNSSCTSCGEGIYSEPKDKDENPTVASGLVAATPSSCYIEPGFGMIAQGNNKFVGQACPINTYGAAGKVWGWAAAPCKPCPRNMITDGATKVANMSGCVNDNGFGMASEGASRCAPGFWAAKGSLKPCQQCPAGRTTDYDKDKQKAATDCYVKEGFGVVNSTANATDAFTFSTTGLTNDTLANLPVVECPIGMYSSDEGQKVLNRRCMACTTGSSTQEPGRSNSTQCDVCSAGYGKVGNACTMCAYGTFASGPNTGACTACPVAKYYMPVSGLNVTITSLGWTTYPGASGEEVCVSKTSQVSPDGGQAFLPNISNPAPFTLAGTSNDTLDKCINACDPPNQRLCFAQWDTQTKKCAFASLAPIASNNASVVHLVYKLLPSSVSAASSLQPGAAAAAPEAATDGPPSPKVAVKSMPSGYYAHGHIVASDVAAWSGLGSHLTESANTFSSSADPRTNVNDVKDCKKICDNSAVCWGFVWTPSAGNQGTCNFRGAIDATNSVAFFDMPTAFDLAPLKW